ncbi:hypothetical protein [Chryseobacterium sp. JV274]|uniref:hypothetical protein n=1 Tax=Chryseobacterium sp. JV274 TaxID=1932669 RepID=UPI0015C24FFF|nr:hypothetical protein [Chryseobacterium sp. JV274]CAD0218299.1 conserved protein of unknown function [Chryseobacterium sp. JV274]
MAEIQRNSTGLSGEYFVAAELLRRGFSVGITMGNAKAIDILAEKDDKKFVIQVKAIYKRKNNGWPIMKERINLNHYYIFVNLNADQMSAPDFYIATGQEAYDQCRQYSTRGIITISTLNNPLFLSNWDKLKKDSFTI